MEEPQDVVADRILRDLLVPRSNSKAEININASGAGVMVVVCVALVMFAINVMQSRQIERQDQTIDEMERRQAHAVDKMERKYERMQDHLSAIYMMAPQLNPPPEKKQE